MCGREVKLTQETDTPHCTMCGSDVVELTDQGSTNHVELLSSTDSVLALDHSQSNLHLTSTTTNASLENVAETASTNSASTTSAGATGSGGLFSMLDDIVDALVVTPLNALSGAVGLSAAAPHEFRPPPASAQYVAELTVTVLESEEQVVATRAECAQCAICMCAFERGDRVMHLLCRHPFHDDCVLPWLKQTSTCPSCRFQLPTDDRKFERRKKH